MRHQINPKLNCVFMSDTYLAWCMQWSNHFWTALMDSSMIHYGLFVWCPNLVASSFPTFSGCCLVAVVARLLGLMCSRACRQIVQEALFETLGLWYAGRIAEWKYGTDISLTSLIHTLFVYYDIAEWDLFLRALEFVIFKISQQFYFPLLSTFTSTISHLFLLEWETTVSSIQIY